MSSAQGAQAVLYIEPGVSPHTFDASSELLVFDSETLRRSDEMIDAHGIRGTRSHHHGRVVRDRYTVGGNIVAKLTQQNVERWVQRILGGTTAAGSTDVAETLNDHQFGVLVDRVANTFEYTDCKVNQAIIRGTSGGTINMELEVFGKTEVVGSTIATPPTYSAADNTRPIVFKDGTLTLENVSRQFENFTMTFNNSLARHFRNSETALSIDEQDRLLTLSVQLPWTAALQAALYGLDRDGSATCSLNFASPTGATISFVFGTLVAPAETPTVPGKSDIPFTLNWTAYADNSGNELQVVIA